MQTKSRDQLKFRSVRPSYGKLSLSPGYGRPLGSAKTRMEPIETLHP